MDASHSAVVPGSASGIRKAGEALGEFAAALGLGSEALWPFRVALDEVLANIVGHAYAGGPSGAIELEFHMQAGVLRLTVLDDGAPFDPLGAPPPDLSAPLARRAPGGLGIALVRALMDSVAYERRGGRNRLVLERKVGA
jgi:anti-sigma regulatory factor (Ser/Thr protein kinase)